MHSGDRPKTQSPHMFMMLMAVAFAVAGATAAMPPSGHSVYTYEPLPWGGVAEFNNKLATDIITLALFVVELKLATEITCFFWASVISSMKRRN